MRGPGHCGIYIDEGLLYTNDPRVIGEYLSFRIEQLDAMLASETR